MNPRTGMRSRSEHVKQVRDEEIFLMQLSGAKNRHRRKCEYCALAKYFWKNLILLHMTMIETYKQPVVFG